MPTSLNTGSDAAAAIRPASPASRPVIIVVDDDPAMNQAVERLLFAAGFPAFTFPSAEALLESGQAADAGCLVLDVHLPGISGFELHRQLAASGHRPPVIFISGHDTPGFRGQAKDAGAVACFPKPFASGGFLAAVSAALSLATGPPGPACPAIPGESTPVSNTPAPR